MNVTGSDTSTSIAQNSFKKKIDHILNYALTRHHFSCCCISFLKFCSTGGASCGLLEYVGMLHGCGDCCFDLGCG